MAEGAQEERWNRTSEVLAMLANTHRDPKRSRRFTGSDFHPFRQRRQKAPISILKDLFVTGRKERRSDRSRNAK